MVDTNGEVHFLDYHNFFWYGSFSFVEECTYENDNISYTMKNFWIC